MNGRSRIWQANGFDKLWRLSTHGVLQGFRAVRASPPARSARRGRGFTILEVLVVLAIIGMIVGLAAPRLFTQLSGARAKTATLQIESLGSALDIFFLDNGRYPSASEGLAALMRKPADAASWNGPYVKGADLPKDPWGNAYLYRAPGRDGPYDIISLGSDGREGGDGLAADIVAGSRR